MVLGPKTINKTINVYGLLGGMRDVWKQFQESDMWSPQRQFGEESSKIGRWIGTVMFRRKKDNGENAHNFSYTEDKKIFSEGTILCDP